MQRRLLPDFGLNDACIPRSATGSIRLNGMFPGSKDVVGFNYPNQLLNSQVSLQVRADTRKSQHDALFQRILVYFPDHLACR
jgi:hypothetical protein